MSDEQNGQQPAGEGADENRASTKPEQASSDEPEQDTLEYWQQRARQHEDYNKQLRAQVKELKPKAAELDKRNEADKSEVDKLTESNSELSTRASSAEHDLARYKAAVKAGVTGEDIETFAARLQGETAEELEADAAELRKLISGANSEQEPSTNGRRPDRSQGASGGQAMSPSQEFANFMQNLK